jgi:hypothetical protein
LGSRSLFPYGTMLAGPKSALKRYIRALPIEAAPILEAIGVLGTGA